jgi:O-antigen chain-terminating methyltransferase
MIESNNLEIDVDELMQQVRDEVSKRHNITLPEDAKYRLIGDIKTNTNSQIIESLLNEAELFSQVPSEFPQKFQRFPFNLSQGLQSFVLKLYGFLFKKQRVVNFSLIQALRESLNLNQQLIEQVTNLQFQVKEISDRLKITEERLTSTDGHLKDTDGHLKDLDERYFRNDSYLKNDLAQQKRLIALFLEEARQRLPEPFNPEQLQTFVQEDQHLLDAFYVAFEEYFRGSREDILNRLKVYLPLIEEAKIGTAESPILDLGCGRGEWLELLRESSYTARGIDTNRVMIEQCRNRGLEAFESDAITYLQSLPDASLGAVTGFHIIEHLPLPVLIELLNQTARVLKSGGLAIFETPNPQNILVGSNNFYIDPTHRNPLPSTLSKFMLENTGLTSVKIMNLNPYQESYKVSGSEQIVERFNDYFYGSQDYAVVGYKV